MILKAYKTTFERIQHFRKLFLDETKFQVRYNACFERGWADCYLLEIDNEHVGYGAVKGQEIKGRDTVFEFYIAPAFRKYSSIIFAELITSSGVSYIESQSNDLFLSSLFFEFSENISSDTLLFDENIATEFSIPGVIFRLRSENDVVFKHTFEPVGDFVLDMGGEIVATGGYMLYYNMPFTDLYMEVKENFRGKGFGSFLIQELKKSCYLSGRVPAARCGICNYASKGTLIKAGLKVCGLMLKGEVKKGFRNTYAIE